MAETTPRLGLYKPADDGSEPVNVATDINDNLERLDATVGAVPATTSTPPATPFNGMIRQNTDDQSLYYYRNNTTWTQILAKGAAFAGHALLTLGNKIGVGTLNPTAVLDAVVSASSETLARLKVGAEVNPRIQIDADGVRLGPGGATATDVRMYRQNAATLNVDGNVVFEDNIQVNGTPSFGSGVGVTGILDVDGEAQLHGGIAAEDHISFQGFPMLVGQRGSVTTGATGGGNATFPVSFGRTYPTPPTVLVGFNTAPSASANWSVRAIAITTTGFSIYVFGGTATYSGVPTNWAAFHEGI